MNAPTEPGQSRAEIWRRTLSETVQNGGFFEEIGRMHKALYVPKGSSTLVVTFDNLDDVRQDAERLPWGVEFIASQGWSSLGILAHGSTWFRDDALIDFFDRLGAEKYFDQFEKVVFYGTSMGGYGACAYSACVTGARVLAINPQATLDRDVTRWERRFRPAWKNNFKSKYGYAPDSVKTAEKVHIFFDPTIAADAMHAALFQGDNIERIMCPLMGHGMLSTWHAMGILNKIISGCIQGTLSRHDLHVLLRARRETGIYQKLMLRYLKSHRRHDLIIPYCRAVIARRYAPHFRAALNESLSALEKA